MPSIVGTWKLVKSTNYPDGISFELILELKKDGKLAIRQSENGQTSVYEGEYEVLKGEIPYSVKFGGGEKKETLKIKKMTDKELHVVE